MSTLVTSPSAGVDGGAEETWGSGRPAQNSNGILNLQPARPDSHINLQQGGAGGNRFHQQQPRRNSPLKQALPLSAVQRPALIEQQQQAPPPFDARRNGPAAGPSRPQQLPLSLSQQQPAPQWQQAPPQNGLPQPGRLAFQTAPAPARPPQQPPQQQQPSGGHRMQSQDGSGPQGGLNRGPPQGNSNGAGGNYQHQHSGAANTPFAAADPRAAPAGGAAGGGTSSRPPYGLPAVSVLRDGSYTSDGGRGSQPQVSPASAGHLLAAGDVGALASRLAEAEGSLKNMRMRNADMERELEARLFPLPFHFHSMLLTFPHASASCCPRRSHTHLSGCPTGHHRENSADTRSPGEYSGSCCAGLTASFDDSTGPPEEAAAAAGRSWHLRPLSVGAGSRDGVCEHGPSAQGQWRGAPRVPTPPHKTLVRLCAPPQHSGALHC